MMPIIKEIVSQNTSVNPASAKPASQAPIAKGMT